MLERSSLLTKNVEDIYPSREALREKIRSQKIKLYAGIDPSSAQIHLGNAVLLRKLKAFQNEGHKVILLIGDFTGMIGDPSDKESTRPVLTRAQVKANAKNYQKQAAKILDFAGKNPCEIKYNSHWLGKLNLDDLIELAGYFTVQQMLERDMFQERLEKNKPIGLHEFLYPLLQGYDSVVLDVDLEVGGTDQTFNMLAGRTLIKRLRNKEKFVLTVPLLEGLDGRKMSKSYNNTINLSDTPVDMYGKVMSLKDDLIIKYFDLCTDLAKRELDTLSTQLNLQAINPMEAKKKLAFMIVNLYHGEEAARKAQAEFTRIFQKREAPKPKKVSVKEEQQSLVDLLTKHNLAKSKSEARRLITQGGVVIDGKKELDPDKIIKVVPGTLVKAGKFKAIEF